MYCKVGENLEKNSNDFFFQDFKLISDYIFIVFSNTVGQIWTDLNSYELFEKASNKN